MDNNIDPPWIKYPIYPPGDFFWREAGEPWFIYVWEPFWKSLTLEEQKEYLSQYEVPEEWLRFYFDSDFQNWLDSVDEN